MSGLRRAGFPYENPPEGAKGTLDEFLAERDKKCTGPDDPVPHFPDFIVGKGMIYG